MSSRCRRTGLLACPLILLAGVAWSADLSVLKVCADPNNLPYSNQRAEGLENKLAELLAAQMNAKVEYIWWAERKSFLKNSLQAGKCDAVMGVPTALDSVEVTRPYYRSTYVFLSRKDRNLHLSSLDDPRLEQWRIGIHVVDDNYAPPANALARRGLAGNLKGYSLFGEYGEENPPARLVEAVAKGDVDLAIVWGPFAGYFAKHQSTPLEVVPVSPAMYLAVPFTYDMSVAVRKGDTALRDRLDQAILSQCTAIQVLLTDYGIPQVSGGERKIPCESSRPLSSSSH